MNNSASAMALTPGVGVPRAFTWKNKPEEYLSAMRRGDPNVLPGNPQTSHFASTSTVDFQPAEEVQKQPTQQEGELMEIGAEVRNNVLSKAPSAVGSVVEDNDLEGPVLDAERKSDAPQIELSRRHSLTLPLTPKKQHLNEHRWARRMSFGDAEEAVLTWVEIIDVTEYPDDLASLQALGEIAYYFNQEIDNITNGIEPWVTEKLKAVELLNDRYAKDKDELQALYQQLNEACQRVRVNSNELLAEERSHLAECMEEIKVLVARLDYEINALLQKVVDVEDGIMTFERQVDDMEKKAADLKVQLETEGWLHWLVRTLTGIGTGPNITRSTL